MTHQSLTAIVALALFGCQNTSEPPSTRGTTVSMTQQEPPSVTRVRFVPRNASSALVAQEATVLISAAFRRPVLGGATVDRSYPVPEIAADGKRMESVLIKMHHPDVPDARVTYHSDTDTLDVRNYTVRRDHSVQGTDVGEGAARDIARKAHAALESARILQSSRFDFHEAIVRTRKEAQGSSDGGAFESWIAQYVFFAPLRVNGIPVTEVSRDLGILIAVHRSGVIARIRVDGLSIAREGSGGLVEGETAAVALRESGAEAEARTEAQAPGGPDPVIQPIGMRYLFPPGGSSIPEAPHWVFRAYSPILNAEGNAVGQSKAHYVLFPVDGDASSGAHSPRASVGGRAPDTR